MVVEKKFERVWLLRHIHLIDDDEDQEETKLIGVYSTLEKAEEAIKRAVLLPGFADFPEGFELSEYIIDKDNWTSGFITVAATQW